MTDYAAIPADLDRPKRKRDWVGRLVRVRADRRIETNGGDIFDAGAVLMVSRNFGGLQLKATFLCPCCHLGKHFHIRGASENDVDLLPAHTPVPTPLDVHPPRKGT